MTNNPTSSLSVQPSRIGATIQQALGGYVNTALTVVQGLLLVPLYLYYIGAETYGYWLASGGMLGILGLVNFGISGLLIQRISNAYALQNFSLVGAYFLNGAVIYLAICFLYGAVGWLVSIWLPELLKLSSENAEILRSCVRISILALVFGIFNECLRGFCQGLLRPLVPAIAMAVGRLCGIVVTVWMLYTECGLWSIPIGLLFCESSILIINLIYSIQLFGKLKVATGWDINIIREFMRISPALLMARAGSTVSQQSEPLLITVFLGAEVTTAYTVTRRAAEIVLRFLSEVTGSTMGSFSHLASSDERIRTVKVAKNLLVLSFSLSAMGFAAYVGANSAFVSLWVGKTFSLDQSVTLFIALGFFARTIQGLMSQLLYGLADFIYPSRVILLQGVVHVGLIVILINYLDLLGVAISLFVSYLAALIFLGFRLKEKLAVDFDIFTISRYTFSAGLLFWFSNSAAQMIGVIDSWSRFIFCLMIIVISVATFYALLNLSRAREALGFVALFLRAQRSRE